MVKTILILCAAALAFGADDPWAKVKELKTGAELHVYKRGVLQPLNVKMNELTDDNLVVVSKNTQMAIPRDQIERIDARPSGRTRTVTNTGTAEQNAATDPRSAIPGPNQPPGAVHASTTTTASGVTWTKQDFETIYRKTAGSPPKK
jgi:hypothetical protein